ncbi:hypothetical protein JW960_10940 [candidate division KSB1 bacterium]|nr:hypothetical protein [candidate division KSB1 bacterium]
MNEIFFSSNIHPDNQCQPNNRPGFDGLKPNVCGGRIPIREILKSMNNRL